MHNRTKHQGRKVKKYKCSKCNGFGYTSGDFK